MKRLLALCAAFGVFAAWAIASPNPGPSTQSSVTVRGLACGTTYRVRINKKGSPNAVTTLRLKTLACPPPSTTTTEPPPPTTTSPPPPPPDPPPPSPGDCDIVVGPGGSIQAALDAVQPGQTICVRPGTYSGSLVFERDLSSFATLACDPGAILTSGGHTLRINEPGSHLRVQGCAFRNAGVSSGGIIDLYGSHIVLEENEVSGSNDNGIYTAEESDHVSILNNHIHHNGAPDSNQDHGIYLQGDDHLVQGNSIHDHPLGFGIQMYDNGRGNRAIGNTISSSGHAGIVVGGGSSGDYRDVEIAGNVVRESASSTDIRNDRLDGDCAGDIYENQTQKEITGFPAGCAVNNTIIP